MKRPVLRPAPARRPEGFHDGLAEAFHVNSFRKHFPGRSLP